jgi:hypothetical protein
MASCSTKWPPKLENDAAYENWKKDIEIWCDLSELPKTKQALAIHLSLSGRARAASSEIETGDLKKDDGVKTLLEKLDGLFLADKGRRQFAAFHELYNFRRVHDVNISKFVIEFEHVYFKFTKQDMKLPDSVMAFMLLASCNLSDSEQQLVMSAIADVSYSNMKSALKRIFAGEICSKALVPQASVEVKSEAVFYSENSESEEVLYARGNRRRRPFSGRRWSRGQGRNGGRASFGGAQQAGRRQNPHGPDGNVSRCLVCDSRFHWARDCPDAYENSGDTNDHHVPSESVHLSLFMGYASDVSHASKLQTLVKESTACAVLDTGCSTTVCGSKWLNDYLGELSDYERSTVKEENSSSTFTFGDGVTVSSLKRVLLPCYIGGMHATVSTDVVNCNIPLLLSKCSMKKAKMCLDFENDMVKVSGSVIQLKSSSSGHYLLPLSL